MPFRPRFNKYFSGDWEHDSSSGVGLKFTGYPNDLDKFMELLHGESCHPVATRRILEELKEKNVKYTTLMSHLNFNFIGDELKKMGVSMEVVPPAPSEKLQNQQLDHLAFAIFNGKQDFPNIHISNEDKQEVEKRLDVFKKSYESHMTDFGPYDPNPQKSSDAIKKIKNRKP